MPHPSSPVADTQPGHADIDPGLLQNTQAYLDHRSRRLSPPRELSAAWEQFYRIADHLIRSYARTCQVSETDLDDCVQQVWAELTVTLRDFVYDARRGRFGTWLYTVVHSKAVDLLRRRVRQFAFSLPFEAEAVLVGREPDPAAECERQCQQTVVWRVLAELDGRVSVRSYLVLYLRCLEGWSVQEVADCLSLTPAQVRFRAHRMKQKFRRLFKRFTSEADPPGD